MALNNIKTISKVDKGNYLRYLSGFSDQCQDAVDIAKACKHSLKIKKIQNVVILGMGGSAIGGDLIKNFLMDELPVPIIANRSFKLPHFVNERSLVFAISYSGNTEETLTTFKEALKRKTNLVVISSGGRLSFLSSRQKLPLIKIPPGLPPRAALAYLFLPIIIFLEKWKLIKNQSLNIIEAINVLRKQEKLYNPTLTVPGNRAKEIALKIHKKFPLIIATEGLTDSIALRWKCQINENSKNMAFIQLSPELGHNDIEGWKGAGKLSKNLIGLILKTSNETEDNVCRLDAIESQLKNHVSDILNIQENNSGKLAQILSLCYLGDYVSFYLSVLNKVDPTPVSNIDALKSKLIDHKRKVLKKKSKLT